MSFALRAHRRQRSASSLLADSILRRKIGALIYLVNRPSVAKPSDRKSYPLNTLKQVNFGGNAHMAALDAGAPHAHHAQPRSAASLVPRPRPAFCRLQYGKALYRTVSDGKLGGPGNEAIVRPNVDARHI